MTARPGRHGERRVCIGGTFDRLHRAHRELLTRACDEGDRIFIGITSDKMAKAGRKGMRLQPYSARAGAVASFLKSRGRPFEIFQLNDKHGPAAHGPYDAIIVSHDTHNSAEEINKLRRNRHLPPLQIIEMDMVLAEDGLPLSSSRIRDGEVDGEGHLKVIRFRVGSANPVKVEAVRTVLRQAFRGRRLEVEGRDTRSEVPSEPFGKDVINGALHRAENALLFDGWAHFGVGIEAGLFWFEHLQDYIDVQYCAILDRGGRITLGHGPGFQYPPPLMSLVKNGQTVGEAMAHLTGIQGIGRKKGVVGYLSKGILVRKKLTESAVIAALLPRLNPELYSFG
jgi:inosine/xanthosine triphosphatase